MCILYLCIAVSVFCCIFLFPLISAYLSFVLSAVRTYLPTVSFRLKGETVTKMPKTCANVPRSPRPIDYYIAICCHRVNAALSANFINLCFCCYQRQPFCLLSPFAFQFQFIFFRFFLSRILCSHTHRHTCLYRQIPDKWQFNNEKLKENTKYFFRPSAEKELISLAARRTGGRVMDLVSNYS